MIWTFCELRVIACEAFLRPFINDQELRAGEVLSFSKVVPVASFDDEVLLAAWGCSGLPEEVGLAYWDAPGLLRLRFRVPGGPPVFWLLRAAQHYKDLAFVLTHATEATCVCGEVHCAKGITETTEVSGDVQKVEKTIAELTKGGRCPSVPG
jgi:hypothetical protein